MRRFLKNNGLTVVLMLLFAFSIIGQWLTGWRVENEELAKHGGHALTLGAYTTNAQFISTIFENWESEFLQMSAYVLLTCWFFQKGSAELSDPEAPPRDGDLEGQARKEGAPAILKRGPVARWLYANSLGHRVAAAVPGVLPAALEIQRRSGRRGGAQPTARRRSHGRASVQRPALVRILPELAERVPVDRGPGRPDHLPEAAGIAGIEGGRGPARADGA